MLEHAENLRTLIYMGPQTKTLGSVFAQGWHSSTITSCALSSNVRAPSLPLNSLQATSLHFLSLPTLPLPQYLASLIITSVKLTCTSGGRQARGEGASAGGAGTEYQSIHGIEVLVPKFRILQKSKTLIHSCAGKRYS